MQNARRRMPSLPFLLPAIVVAAGLALTAHGRQAPTFKAQVDVVPVDLVVTDREGRPVAGLRPEDFQVTVDGQPRKVLTAQFLSSAASPAAPQPGVGLKSSWDIDAALESVYVTNDRAGDLQAVPSRSVMIAIDQGGFGVGAGRVAATAARGLLDMLHPNDRVGLAAFPAPGPFVRPTRDHQRVRQALGQITGTAEPLPRSEISLNVADAFAWTSGDKMSRDMVVERFCAVSAAATCEAELDRAAAEVVGYARRQSLVSLRGLSDVIRAATLDESASAIVVVSTGLYATGRGSQLGVDGEARNLGRLAATSRAMLHALYVESGFLDRDSMDRRRIAGFSSDDGDLRLEGLRYLAGLAGGTVTRVAGSSDTAFRRVSLELSAYYLLGIESSATDRDGRRHRLRVTVNRPGVTARSREDLYLPAAKKQLTGEEAVRDALGASSLARALPIRLSTWMMREPGTDTVRLVISASIDQAVKAPAAVRVGYVIQGAGTEATAGASEIRSLTLPVVGTGNDASLSYLETAQLTAGRYLLRLAAAHEDGRVGSVQQVVDATLIAGEVGTFSDLLLIDPSRMVKDRLTPVADGRITGDRIGAFLEIYPGPDRTVGAVAFDVGDTPGGPAIVTGSAAPQAREGRLVASVDLELRALPPGAYVLNARVVDGDRLLGRTSRPFLLDRSAAGPPAPGEPRAALAFAATGALVRGFAREDALRADAVGYFLNRMHAAETASTGEAVSEATAALRAARFDAALAALPGSSDVLSVAFLKGLALLGQGQLEPAAEQFRTALRISSDFLPAAFYLGACYAAGGRDREAVGAWQTSLVSETDSRIVYEVLADALLRLKDGEQAEAIIEEARARWPGDDLFAFRLIAAKVVLNRRAEALAMLEPYIERHQAESEPLFLAVRLLYEAHDGGKPLKGKAEDRALAEKYGALYAATEGTSQPLVRRWVSAMTR